MIAGVVLAFMFLSSGIAGDAHVLDVPYRNQLDGSSYEQANCGPTALSMALAYYGIDASPWDLRVRAMKEQHTWVTDEGGYSDRWGVFVYNLAATAEEFGIHADGIWNYDGARSDSLRQWVPLDLRRELNAGHPVIVEVKYRLLPAHAGATTSSDHYIVLRGTAGDDFVYADPYGNHPDSDEVEISEPDLLHAMSGGMSPFAGFAAVKPAT